MTKARHDSSAHHVCLASCVQQGTHTDQYCLPAESPRLRGPRRRRSRPNHIFSGTAARSAHLSWARRASDGWTDLIGALKVLEDDRAGIAIVRLQRIRNYAAVCEAGDIHHHFDALIERPGGRHVGPPCSGASCTVCGCQSRRGSKLSRCHQGRVETKVQ